MRAFVARALGGAVDTLGRLCSAFGLSANGHRDKS